MLAFLLQIAYGKTLLQLTYQEPSDLLKRKKKFTNTLVQIIILVILNHVRNQI